MSHQLNFYITPGDTDALEAVIRAVDDIYVVPSRFPDKAPQIVPSLRWQRDGVPWLLYFLVRSSDYASLRTSYVERQGYWTLDELRSPVIEFTGSFFDGEILRRGRVYYQDGYWGPSDEWIEKPEEFRRWGKTLFSRIRRSLVRQDSEYIGKDAKAWLERSHGKLVAM